MNILEQAAEFDSRSCAASLIFVSLELTDTEPYEATFPSSTEWSAMNRDQRLAKIASWMVAECFEAMQKRVVRQEAAE